jgi:hypothetical protein
MERNRYLEAFKESYNVLGLSAAAAASLALMATPFMPIPILVGLVAEAAYILFVSDSRWYQLRLAKRFDADIEKRRAQLKSQVMPTLQPSMQARFTHLEKTQRSINDQAADQPEWFREVLRKLDFLLEKFLHFAAKDAQFHQYLESVLVQECGSADVGPNHRVNPQIAANVATQLRSGRGLAGTLPPVAPPQSSRAKGHIPSADATILRAATINGNAKSANAKSVSPSSSSHDWTNAAVARIQAQYNEELAELRQNAENESDSSTRAVLEKRLDVLGRRREFIGKIGRIQTNLLHQLSLVEDTFGLISDEIRAQPPEQVLADINDVVSQTNTMTQLLEEFAPFENSLSI